MITSPPTTDRQTKTVTVSGIPAGVPILGAAFEATFGSPLSGIAELTVNGQELRQSSDMPNEPFRYEWFSVQLTTDAERSLQWIRENTALTPVTLRDAGAGNTP